MNVEIVNLLKPTKMSQCPNCKSTLSCGCQRRTASDGTAVCGSCLSTYEARLQNKTQTKQTKQTSVQQPNNVWGKDRYRNLHKFIK